MPQISVIIPTYNRTHLIEYALKSVLNQTFTDYELIIVDDHSRDNTREKIELMHLPNCKYIYNDKNYGPAVSRNIGIKNSSGKYIAFLDSDDEWLPQKLEKQLNLLESSGSKVGAVYTASMIRRGSSLIPYLPFKWIRNSQGNIYNELLINNFLDTPAMMIKKQVLDKIGVFDETFESLEDYDLFLRIAKHYDILLVNEPLLISTILPDGVNSKNLAVNARMLLKILEKNYAAYQQHAKGISSLYFNVGDYYYQTGNYENGKYYIHQSLVHHFSIITAFINILTNIPGVNKSLYMMFRRIISKVYYVLTGKGHFFVGNNKRLVNQ